MLEPIKHVKARIVSKEFEFPKELMGVNASSLKPAKAIVIDVIETVAAMLISKDVVGTNGEFFNYTYEEERNMNGTRVYSNTTSAEWFRLHEIAIKEEYGEDVVLVALVLSTDKTALTRVGGIKVWPCYLTIGNLTSGQMRSPKGSELVGYCPLMPYTDNQMMQILTDHGVVSYKKEACKMLRHYFEQQFLRALIDPIIKMQESGPVVLDVGHGTVTKRSTMMFHIEGFVCK